MSRNTGFRFNFEHVLRRKRFPIAEPLENGLLRNPDEPGKRGLRANLPDSRSQSYNFR